MGLRKERQQVVELEVKACYEDIAAKYLARLKALKATGKDPENRSGSTSEIYREFLQQLADAMEAVYRGHYEEEGTPMEARDIADIEAKISDHLTSSRRTFAILPISEIEYALSGDLIRLIGERAKLRLEIASKKRQLSPKTPSVELSRGARNGAGKPESYNASENSEQTTTDQAVISVKDEKRSRVLQRVYLASKGNPSQAVSDGVVTEGEGVTADELANEIYPYLVNEGYLKYITFGNVAISHRGIKRVEERLRRKTTPNDREEENQVEEKLASLAARKAGATIDKDPTKVWVVHGRNLKARNAMFEFLSAVGLQPLEWSQAKRATGKPNASIQEILDTAFSAAGAVVVLFTPDDMAYLRNQLRGQREKDYEINPTPQARPNVLFEAGMAMGRNPERTVLVELGDLRPFTDISGLHLVRISDSTETRQDLIDSLESARCPVDLSGRRWHTAGRFDAALEGL